MCCYSYIYPPICIYVCMLIQLCPTLATPRTIAHQASLSMGFSKQEYRSGLPFHTPGDLLDPGIKPASMDLLAKTEGPKEAQSAVLGSAYMTCRGGVGGGRRWRGDVC